MSSVLATALNSTSPMRLLAGPKAFQHISQHGLNADDICAMLGASGGPKWFVLYHLDRYLAGDFFANRVRPLDLLGTSAGGWRFGCYCQQAPKAALERFIEHYAGTVYTDRADATEVTDKARLMVKAMLGPKGALEIIQHPSFRLHLIVAKAKNLAAGKTPLKQLLGVTAAAGSNLLSRKALANCYERVLFHVPQASSANSPFFGLNDYPTQEFALSQESVEDALMATGSIPIALHPVTHIEGPGSGCYVDGGVIDYHFDLPISPKGIVLYPHFYPHITPGWFDKALKWRKAQPENYQNVLLACPSETFVKALPFGKLSDRNDFKTMAAGERQSYWQTVISEGERLAEFFAERVEKQDWMDYLQLMDSPSRG